MSFAARRYRPHLSYLKLQKSPQRSRRGNLRFHILWDVAFAHSPELVLRGGGAFKGLRAANKSSDASIIVQTVSTNVKAVEFVGVAGLSHAPGRLRDLRADVDGEEHVAALTCGDGACGLHAVFGNVSEVHGSLEAFDIRRRVVQDLPQSIIVRSYLQEFSF